MHPRLLLAELTLPITRLIRVGTGRWLRILAGGAAVEDKVWSESRRRFRTLYNPDIRASVSVDLGDWYGRNHYYSGIYAMDRATPLLIRQFLKDGDTFVDAGAHHGLHTLCAATTVGTTGRVISFEPNPRNYQLLTAHLAINRLGGVVSTHNIGVSDQDGALVLNFSDPIRGSFLNVEPTSMHLTVPVRRGDDVLRSEQVTGRVLLKIDTEGFEHHVLRGMSDLQNRDDLAVWTEVTDKWLRAAGSSQDELFADMLGRGFAAYRVTAPKFGRKLCIKPMSGPESTWQYDVLFAKPAFMIQR